MLDVSNNRYTVRKIFCEKEDDVINSETWD